MCSYRFHWYANFASAALDMVFWTFLCHLPICVPHITRPTSWPLIRLIFNVYRVGTNKLIKNTSLMNDDFCQFWILKFLCNYLCRIMYTVFLVELWFLFILSHFWRRLSSYIGTYVLHYRFFLENSVKSLL